mgnify:CR=1 FL=1
MKFGDRVLYEGDGDRVLGVYLHEVNSKEAIVKLDNSREKYLLVDHKKINKDDFYVFYNLHNIDYLITDWGINSDVQKHYEQYVNIIIAKK